MTRDIHDRTQIAQVEPGLDAGRLREELFQELANSGNTEKVLGDRAQGFYQRVRELERLSGVPFATILADLRAELEGLA